MSEPLNHSDPRVRALVNQIHEQEETSLHDRDPPQRVLDRGSSPRDTRSLLMRYLSQFQSLSLPGVAVCFLPMVFMLAVMTLLGLGLHRISVERGIEGSWPIPPASELLEVSGRLDQPYTISVRRGPDWSIGLVSTDVGQLFEFSCEPGGDDLRCLYSGRYDDPALSGQTVHLKYLIMPKWLYPAFDVRYHDGAFTRVVKQPRVPAAIVMEAAVEQNGAQHYILSYQDSVARLNKHMAPASPLALFSVGWIPLLLILFLIPPAIYRVARGQVKRDTP